MKTLFLRLAARAVALALLFTWVRTDVVAGGTNVFDLAADFSTTSNPNGPWTYFGVDMNGGFHTLTNFGAVVSAGQTINGWFQPSSPNTFIGVSPDRSGALFCNGYYAGNFPPPTASIALDERFTLPPGADGTYIVTTAIYQRPLEGLVVTPFSISKNGQVILSVSQGYLAPTYSTNLTLAAGDTIDFYQEGLNASFGPQLEFEAVLSQGAAAPSILTQPQDQSVTLGGSASFGVTAAGAPPLSYQWLFGTNAIAGATNSVLSLANVQYAQAGDYSVVVSGPGGIVTSSNALLTVLTPAAPGITTQPGNQTLAIGATATLSVVATGSAPLSYQWYVGASGDISSPVAGATNALFTTAQLYSSVSFWVLVQNTYGTAKSAAALLTVGTVAPPPPSLAVQLVSGLASLTLTGQQGTQYEIQFCTSLVNPAWTTLIGFSLPASSITVVDSQAAGSTRFYRAVSP